MNKRDYCFVDRYREEMLIFDKQNNSTKGKCQMTIGERVIELVRERGMTQKEFSERTGIPQSTMSSWKGKKQNPSIDKLKVICDVLKVDPYYLMAGTESNEALNNDYVTVYKKEEEYKLLIEFRKLDRDRKNRLLGYIEALQEKK